MSIESIVVNDYRNNAAVKTALDILNDKLASARSLARKRDKEMATFTSKTPKKTPSKNALDLVSLAVSTTHFADGVQLHLMSVQTVAKALLEVPQLSKEFKEYFHLEYLAGVLSDCREGYLTQKFVDEVYPVYYSFYRRFNS